MNYAAIAANTTALLKRAGMAMTLRVTTPGAYDPMSGTATGDVPADYACVGIVRTPSTSQGESYFANSLIQTGDQIALLSTSVAIQPAPGHVLVISSSEWQVVAVITVAPAGVPVLYKLQVRRG